MLNQLKEKIAELKLSKVQAILASIGASLLLTGVIVFALWRSSQDYVVLFGAQENVNVAHVAEVLGGESISYRVDPVSGQFLVPELDLAEARMALAAKGVKLSIPHGYELMDKEALLGSSQFIQNVRYKRSLEGELAQSVMTLNPVSQARVHLGISEASSFVMNNKPENTASVVVRLHYNQSLNDEQINAIVHLVSGSVPGLNPGNVQVVDQDGGLLSASNQLNGLSIASMKSRADIADRLKAEIERNVAHLLGPLVGNGNYRVSVMPSLDLSKINETQERYLGDPRVNQENINQENASDDFAQGIPGALSNRPANAPNTVPEAVMSVRSQAQRSYAYDRDIRSIDYPGFRLEKMSVAIILNREAPTLKDWSEEQIANLTQLVDDAAGIDRNRGDSLTLSLMTFTAPTQIIDDVLPWWKDPSVMRWAQMFGIGLLSLLFFFLGINPLLKRLVKSETTPLANAVAPAGADGEKTAEDGANVLEEAEGKMGVQLKRMSFNDENLPSINSGLETKIEFLQLLAQNETDRVAEVIKQWINSDDRSNKGAV